MLNMCTKFHENTFDSFNVIEGTISHARVDTLANLKLQRGIIQYYLIQRDIIL